MCFVIIAALLRQCIQPDPLRHFIYYLLPLFSGVEAYLFLGEKLYSADFIGGILVIGGIALVSLKRKATEK